MKRVAPNVAQGLVDDVHTAQVGSQEARLRAFREQPGAPAMQQALEEIVRDAIDAGLTFTETYARVVALLAANHGALTPDDLRRWIRAHALSLT
jgi:hypothetical protein